MVHETLITPQLWWAEKITPTGDKATNVLKLEQVNDNGKKARALQAIERRTEMKIRFQKWV